MAYRRRMPDCTRVVQADPTPLAEGFRAREGGQKEGNPLLLEAPPVTPEFKGCGRFKFTLLSRLAQSKKGVGVPKNIRAEAHEHWGKTR